MITTGDEEPCIHLSNYLAFCQICESTDPNLRSAKILGVLPSRFTTPHAPAVVIHSRKCLRTILQWCCGGYTGQTRAQNERTEDVVPEPDFEIRFLKKACIFRWLRNFNLVIWRSQVGRIKNPLNLFCSTVIKIPRNEFIAQTDQNLILSVWLKKLLRIAYGFR